MCFSILKHKSWVLTFLKNQTLKEVKKIKAVGKMLCAQNGIEFLEKIIFGNELREITEYAIYRKFDLIVVASLGMGSRKRAFLGSVANEVVHKSKIPVLIIKQYELISN
jgi:nucleotide-binding universal stress UspA family protein